MSVRKPMVLDNIMVPEAEQAAVIPAPSALAPSLKIEAAQTFTEPTATITVRVPIRLRDGLRTLRMTSGRPSQELVQFAIERLLSDNGIE